ncbi:MAG: DUF4260 domain-containing protein [Ignavibacteriales bacterium]|nr:DUF4260 domain-containing protein [Ignavibacteriales bacterium]
MKYLLKMEELFLFILSIYLFSKLEISWWWFPALLLIPDIGMIGYIFNTRIGAIAYNIVHHRAISISLYIIGAIIYSQTTQLIGIILFAHSTIDRVFDYGFKYLDNFKHTHLTEIETNVKMKN